MLKKIIFDISPELATSFSVQQLLHSFPDSLEALFCSPLTVPAYSPENCLVITDSSSGIRNAKSQAFPCIGYAPPGTPENLSGAYALFEDFASVDATYFYRTHAHAIGYPATILTTKRLLVREFSQEDFPALFTMCTEPSTASFMKETLSDFNTEQEKHAAYIRNVYPLFDLALWAICDKSSGRLIGRAGFSLPKGNDDTFRLGYLIDLSHRKRGYAKECIPALLHYAKEQGYSIVSAEIKPENIASRRTIATCGFPFDCKTNNTTGVITYIIRLTL